MKSYFVSSTFRDMQAERDAINHKVIPTIKSHAYQKGVDIAVVDLRWGISTEELDSEQGVSKILSVCMSEIDYCQPHMIILLGDRYGFIPSRETVERILKDDTMLAIGEDVADKSVTELEIRYNLAYIKKLQMEDQIPLTVCIRRSLPYDHMAEKDRANYLSTDSAEREKITALRAYFEQNYPDQLLYYDAQWDAEHCCVTGLDEFVRSLTKRLLAQLACEWPEQKRTAEELQLMEDHLLGQQHRALFVGREDVLNRIEACLKSGAQILMLIGPSGSGKSCLASQLGHQLEKDDEVVALYAGNGQYASSTTHIIKNLVWRLEQLLSEEHRFFEEMHSLAEWRAHAESLLKILTERRPITVIVDALNMLYDTQHVNELDFLPLPSDSLPRYRLVLTSTELFHVPEHISRSLFVHTVRIGTLTEEDIRRMVASHLRHLRKELPAKTREEIVSATLFRTPLYLALLMQRLSMLAEDDFAAIRREPAYLENEEEALYQYITRILARLPKNEALLAVELFERAAEILGFPEYREFLMIMLLFPDGLRPEDYIGIFSRMSHRLSALTVSQFIHSLSVLFTMDEMGKIRFSHQIVADGATRTMSTPDDSNYHAILAYLDDLSDCDPVKLQSYLRCCFLLDLADAGSAYLGRLALESESLALHHIPNAYEAVQTAVSAYRNFYLMEPQRRGELVAFLFRMNDAAARTSVECLHGFTCAILFTYDTLFIREMSFEDKHSLMENLCAHCEKTLYPAGQDNPLLLRTVYVCCEQCGHRMSKYAEKLKYYEKFYTYCSELYKKTDVSSQMYPIILHDMTICYTSLATMYLDRNYRKAVELYGIAIRFAEQYVRLVSLDNIRYGSAQFMSTDIKVQRAGCVINRALRDKMIGFPSPVGMEELLQKSYDDLNWCYQEYLRGGSHQLRDLAVCCSNLCSYYRLMGDVRHEASMMLKGKDYAEQDVRAGHPDSLRMVSQLYFALAYREEFGYSLDVRLAYMSQAFQLGKQLHSLYSLSDPIFALEIIKKTLINLMRLRIQLINAMKEDGDPEQQQTITEQYIAIFSEIKDYLPDLLSGRDITQVNQLIRQTTKEGFQFALKMKEQAIAYYTSREYDCAIETGRWSLQIQQFLDDFTDSSFWLMQIMNTCNLLAICYHNRLVHGGDAQDIEQELTMTRLYLYYEKRLRGMTDVYRRFSDVTKRMESVTETTSVEAWLQFAAHCFSSSKEKAFWKVASDIPGYFPGQKTVYLYLYRTRDITQLQHWANVVGQYFCTHIGDDRVLQLMIHSDFFEAVALEYAYQNGLDQIAATVIDNGYRKYLELPLLYIIRKYDRKTYLSKLSDLQGICLKHRREEIRWMTDVLGKAFCDEFLSEYSRIRALRRLTKQ